MGNRSQLVQPALLAALALMSGLTLPTPARAEDTAVLERGVTEFEIAPAYRYGHPGLSLDLNTSYGVTDRLTLFAEGPLLFGRSTPTESDEAAKKRASGAGNLTVGSKIQLRDEEAHWLGLIASISITAPTGNDKVDQGADGGDPKSWAAAAGITALHSFGATTLNAAASFAYTSNSPSPKSQIDYSIGADHEFNSVVSFKTELQGTYKRQREEADVTTDTGLTALKLGLAFALSARQSLEPSVTFGIPGGAHNMVIGLSYVIDLGGK